MIQQMLSCIIATVTDLTQDGSEHVPGTRPRYGSYNVYLGEPLVGNGTTFKCQLDKCS